MNFLFAWRYFKSKKSTNAINVIAWISVTAITVVTAALIIVFSVFNGFEDLVRSLYTDFYTDIRITPQQGKIMRVSTQLQQQIQQISDVQGISLIAEEKALLINGDYQAIVYVKGVDENYRSVNGMYKHIVRGKYDVGSADNPKLIIGGGVENAIGVDVVKGLNPVSLYLPNKKADNFNSVEGLNSYNVQPVATFMIQQDFDNKYVFTNLPFLQYMLDLKADEYSAIELKVTTASNTNKVQAALKDILGKGYAVQTRFEQNKSLFTAMQVEKWVIYGITCLILIIAAFNIIGALTMLVLEKQKDITVLKAMGANDGMIKKIFLNEGFILAGIGGISGIVLAAIICWLQIKFKLIKLGGESFIIDYYPVKLVATDFLLVAATIFIIALLAAYIPARKASKQLLSLKS
jgi:lipoprotein-releasing system permease protein